MVSHALERLLRLRDRRQLHRSLLHGNAQPASRHLQPENNRYKNPFGTEIALLRTSEGGMARMAVSWDTPGPAVEVGRVRGQRGSMAGMAYAGLEKKLPDLDRPPLPPSVAPGGHGGSHGHLTNEFVTAILEDRKPLVDIVAGAEHDGRRHRRPSVGPEGRRTAESAAIRLIAVVHVPARTAARGTSHRRVGFCCR